MAAANILRSKSQFQPDFILSDAPVKTKNVLMHDRSLKPAKNPKKRKYPFAADLATDPSHMKYVKCKRMKISEVTTIGGGRLSQTHTGPLGTTVTVPLTGKNPETVGPSGLTDDPK